MRSPEALGGLIATTTMTWIEHTKLPLRSWMLDLHLLTRTNMAALGAYAPPGADGMTAQWMTDACGHYIDHDLSFPNEIFSTYSALKFR